MPSEQRATYMSQPSHHAVTELLLAAQSGDAEAFDALYGMVYEELRRMAHAVRHGEASETLNTTALVHEAYFKLVPSKDMAWQDRTHFFRIAARAMRQVLVDAAHRRSAAKRGAGRMAITFDEQVYSVPVRPDQLITLNDALQELEYLSPRQAQVVECRFFAGLSIEETALALNVSPPTVKRDWRTARAWLAHALA